MSTRIAVLGAGSWGIAVANLLAENNHDIIMWEFNPDELEKLITSREHSGKLPGIKIIDAVEICGDLSMAVRETDIVCIVVPTQKIAEVCRLLAALPHVPRLAVNLSKGIEEKTLRRVSQIIAEEWPDLNPSAIVSLSGPSHAEEVARHMPTSVVVAGEEAESLLAQELFSNQYFRVYRSSDLIGVELGGALKNVIAIAAGITQGLGLGDNTRSALITRGMVEINRLAVELGAQPETMAGLAGIGDLIATCTSRHSRNHYVGYHIGQGKTLDEVLAGMVMVAEGVTTCRSVNDLARLNQIEMPISEAVHAVLFEELEPMKAVASLMTRPLKEEIWY